MTALAAKYPAHGLFVTGSGTDVGKTFVACLLAKKLVALGIRVGVYKPVASGAVFADPSWVSSDALNLWESAGRPGSLADVCPQVFRAPLAPHLAAAEEGQTLNEALLSHGLESWRDRCEFMLVEGAGGLMSPVSDSLYNADLAREFGYRLVVVVPNRLGVINDALQTIMTAKSYRSGMKIAGVVLSDVSPNTIDLSCRSNRQELEKRCGVPILNHVGHGADTWTAGIEWALVD